MALRGLVTIIVSWPVIKVVKEVLWTMLPVLEELVLKEIPLVVLLVAEWLVTEAVPVVVLVVE